jgi:hypothetical protein
MKQFEPTLRLWLNRPVHCWILAGVVALLLAGRYWLGMPLAWHAAPMVAATAPAASAPPPGRVDTAPLTPPLAMAPADVQALRSKIARGPLAGTVLDGELRCNPQNLLEPDAGVRRRFDYYAQVLGAAGEALRLSRQEIAELVGDDARAMCGSAAAEQAQGLWMAYSGINTAVAGTSDPQTLQTALAQRRAARDQALGPQWAQALFGDDDSAIQARLAGNTPAIAPEMPVRDPVAEAQLRAQWADWERRVAAAKGELQHLSPGGAQPTPAQLSALLDKWFAATERARAAAVLGLPVFES